MLTRPFFAAVLTSLLIPTLASAAPASPAAEGSGAAPGSILIDKLLASVNSALILQSDIQKFRQTIKLRSQLDPLFTGTAVASKGTQASDKEIADFLIDEKLIAQAFAISDSETEQEISSIQANNKIDRATLKQALADQGFSFEDYFELIRASASKRNLIDREIRTKVTISDDDVKNYFYNTYTRTSSVPVAYHLELISVSISNYKSVAAARDVAQRALNAIKAGEPFEDVARRMSDHATAGSGGDLGTVTEEQMASQFRDEAKKLKIGGVSDIFGGSVTGAFNILKLIDVKSDDTDRYERMKTEIRNQLTAAEYQHQIALWLERQRQIAFIHRSGEPSFSGLPVAPSKP